MAHDVSKKGCTDYAELLKALNTYREAWDKLEIEIARLDHNNDGLSVKNNARSLVINCRPKEV